MYYFEFSGLDPEGNLEIIQTNEDMAEREYGPMLLFINDKPRYAKPSWFSGRTRNYEVLRVCKDGNTNLYRGQIQAAFLGVMLVETEESYYAVFGEVRTLSSNVDYPKNWKVEIDADDYRVLGEILVRKVTKRGDIRVDSPSAQSFIRGLWERRESQSTNWLDIPTPDKVFLGEKPFTVVKQERGLWIRQGEGRPFKIPSTGHEYDELIGLWGHNHTHYTCPDRREVARSINLIGQPFQQIYFQAGY